MAFTLLTLYVHNLVGKGRAWFKGGGFKPQAPTLPRDDAEL